MSDITLILLRECFYLLYCLYNIAIQLIIDVWTELNFMTYTSCHDLGMSFFCPWLICRCQIFDVFLMSKRGSTYMRIDLYASIYSNLCSVSVLLIKLFCHLVLHHQWHQSITKYRDQRHKYWGATAIKEGAYIRLSLESIFFLFSSLTMLAGQRKGIRHAKELGVGLLAATFWLELCMYYGSSC